MAYKNKIIENPKTGQTIQFIQTSKDTNGALLEMEATFRAYSKEPVAHYHPVQQEDFLVTEGQLHVKMNGRLTILNAGDKLHVPARTIHSMWNNSDQPARVTWKVQPALDTEYFLETSVGLAASGKTNEEGMPRLLQVVAMARKFRNVFVLASPATVVQFVLFSALAPLACIAGYKPVYKQYID